MSKASAKSVIPYALVTLAVVTYLGFALYQYRLPGLYHDEAADVVPAMQLLQGENVDLQRGVGIHLFGRSFPVMIGDYWGVTSTYAVLPLFAIFGIDVFAIRLFPIAACAIAIVGTYALGRSVLDGTVGVVAAALLAVNPTYIFWSRIGIYVIAHIVVIALGIMLAYVSWRTRPRWWKLVLIGLLAGIGLTTKLLFAWFFIAVPAGYAAMLLYDWLSTRRLSDRSAHTRAWHLTFLRGHMSRYVPMHSRADALCLGLGFLVGAFPVIYYNLVSRGSYYLLRSNFGSTERGVDNFAIAHNLQHQLTELQVFLDGGFFWFLGQVHTNSAATYVTALSMVGLAALTLLPEYKRYRRAVVFFYTHVITIFVLSAFSISILAATHLFILLPMPQLFIASCAVLGTRAIVSRTGGYRRKLAVAACAAAALAAYIALDVRTDLQYHDTLAETGGTFSFSDGIYDLASYLDSRGYRRPYALDWGVRPNTMILTDGRVAPREIYGQTAEPGPEFARTVREILATDEHPVFISQTEVSEAFPRLDRFREIVESNGRSVVTEKVILQRNGVPAYYVLRIDQGP